MATTPVEQRALAAALAAWSKSDDERLSPEDKENMARNSVRAAYYAAYHLALAWAEWRGYELPETWGSHEGLWDCWYKQEPQTRAIRTRGNALKSKRHAADYKIHEAFDFDPDEVLKEFDELMELIVKDQNRVVALPEHEQKISWDKKAHPNPKRRRGGRK